MKGEVLELMTQFMMETRFTKILDSNEEYQNAMQKEGELHDQLADGLNEEQKGHLENFIAAWNERASIHETLSYQQGMKDIVSLLVSLIAA